MKALLPVYRPLPSTCTIAGREYAFGRSCADQTKRIAASGNNNIGSWPGDENELRIKLRTQVVGAIHLIFKLIFANKMRDLEATALQNDPA